MTYARPRTAPRGRAHRSRWVGALALVLALTGCAGSVPEASDGEVARVGVAMPTQEHERWVHDGTNVAAQLEALGHQVTLEYADDDSATQAAQVRHMIEDGADALIIGAVDGSALIDVLAAAADIPVISYDRLILGTSTVDYYAPLEHARLRPDASRPGQTR